LYTCPLDSATNTSIVDINTLKILYEYPVSGDVHIFVLLNVLSSTIPTWQMEGTWHHLTKSPEALFDNRSFIKYSPILRNFIIFGQLKIIWWLCEIFWLIVTNHSVWNHLSSCLLSFTLREKYGLRLFEDREQGADNNVRI
jgi:hypothetical protein